MTMFSVNIITSAIVVSMMIENGIGAIWDCDNKYEHKSPQSSVDAEWCADEGGSCSGPGRVYYGEHLTWTYVDYIDNGETIDCSNDAFGCDPLWGTKKRCYIERYRCVDHELGECNHKDYNWWQYDTLYVQIDFSMISILETNGDSESSTDVHEEWMLPEFDSDNRADVANRITMNVDHIQYGAMEGMTTNWGLSGGCIASLGYGLNLETESGDNCNPSAPVSSTETYGFYQCYLPEVISTVVTRDVYEAGLKYTFNFQVGDHDTNGGFDNGPIFDFTYTEPDHRDIWELFESGYVERYFTRTGPEGRKARLFVRYIVIPDYDDLPIYECN